MPKQDVSPSQDKEEINQENKEMRMDESMDLLKLKNRVQNVVNEMDPNDTETQNVDFGQDLEVEESNPGYHSKSEVNVKAIVMSEENKPPRAIDMFAKTQPEIQELESPIKLGSDLEETTENMGDLIKETIFKANNQRERRPIERDRIGRRGWQYRKRSKTRKREDDLEQDKGIKVSQKHLQYLEKLKLKKAQEKLDKENALLKAKQRKEKLKRKILDRCKVFTRTRNVESVNNTQSDFNKTAQTSNSQKQKSFVIRRLKSSNGGKDQLPQTPTLKKESSKGLPPRSGEVSSRIGRRGRKQLAPLTSQGVRPPRGSRGVKDGNEFQRSNKRVMSLVPTMGRSSGLGKKDGDNQQIAKLGARSNSVIKKTKKNKLKSYSFISSVGEWLKKNRLDSKTKVFIISNGYQCIKKALKSRGWVQNPNYFSTCFHLKFTLKGSHIGFDGLNNDQIVNHFEKVSVLTTKVGLTKTMDQLHLFTNINQDSFFPRCYDCSEDMEFESFCMYFKQLEAECIIKNYLDLALNEKREDEKYKLYDENDALQVRVALDVCKRRMMNLGELIDNKKDWVEVTEKEWSILSRGAKTEEDIKQMMFDKNIKRYEKMAQKEKDLAKKRKKKRKKKKKKTKISIPDDSIKEDVEIENEDLTDEEDDDLSKEDVQLTPLEQECRYIIARLERKYPQTRMNGKKNVWIVKPAGLSRGRGIELFSSFHEIYHHLKTRDFSWVIQKYMENPLCYNNKKMDIRQWVLVTDWNPLTVWFYQECYIRLSTNDYSLKNIKNRFTHLTNNSVNKKSDNFTEEDGFVSQEDFAAFMDKDYGEGAWKKIVKQMKKQVKWSLQSAQSSVINRKNSGEIFGYDFCIDEDQKVWLIEINASPDFSFSCDITEDLVRKASEDYIKVMIDWNKASKKKKKNVDTGLFKRTYRSRKHEKCKEALGLKFECKGKKIGVDKYKKFFRKEDREHKANYQEWLEESEQIFDYDSDLEDMVIEEKGAEYSKLSIPATNENVTEYVEDQTVSQAKIEDKKVEKIPEESEDSDDESF